MADEPVEETTETEVEEDETSTPDFAEEVKKWKALARKNEAQAKANAEAARKLAELEDKDKSESERAAKRAADAEARAEKAEAELLRWQVAVDKGLSPSMAKRLQGGTRDELEADADELLEAIGSRDTSPAPDGKPKERLRGGGAPDEEVGETDPVKLAASVPR